MVLGIRTKKSSKTVSNSIQLHYIIHVYEIKPWPPSQSLRSVQSVHLQWQNADTNSGSLLPSSVGNGKIEFNEPFKLSITMFRESSKKGKKRESFKKNYLEFELYDRTVKSQLIGSAAINFADFGIIKEAKAVCFHLNCKKSFKSSVQPLIYVSIQPFDVECSSSSPSSNLSKELSLEREDRESLSQSVKDDDDDDDDDDDGDDGDDDGGNDDIEIASFTDDDETDDIALDNLQTIKSDSKTIGGSDEIGEGGTKGSNGERILPSEIITSSLHVNTKAESPSQINGIKSPSSSPVLRSGIGNDGNGRPSLPKISKRSVKVADASSEIQESIQQSRWQDISVDRFKTMSPSSYISSSMKPHFETSSQSQVLPEDSANQEDSTGNRRYKEDFPKKVGSVSNTGLMEDKEKKDEGRKGREQFTMSNENFENVLDNKEDSTGNRRYKEDFSKKVGSVSNTRVMEDKEKKNEGRKGREQFTMSNENFENVLDNKEDSTGNRRYKEDFPKKVGSVSNTRVMEDKEKRNEGRKGREQFTMSNENFENVLDNKEDSTGNRRYKEDFLKKVGSVSNTRVMEDKEKKSEGRKEREQFTMSNENFENVLDNKEYSTGNRRYKEDFPKKVGSVSNTRVMEDKEKRNEGIKGREQFTMSNEKFENVLDNKEDSTGNRRYKEDFPKKVGSVSNTRVVEDKEKKSEGRKEREQFTIGNENFENVLDNKEDSTGNRRYKEDFPKKVGSVSNTRVMEDKEIRNEGIKGREQFSMSNENFENVLDNNFSVDESTRTEKLKSDSLLPSKKSHEQPAIFSTNEKSEDMRSRKFPLQTTESCGQFIRSQNLDQGEKINTFNGVHVAAACHKDINVNGSFLIDNSELKAEVERLREELREAAALEASMYSVIAEHGSSNKVHAPARRLSRFYFHARRVGSPAKIASAAKSVVSGFVLVSKACGNDVPRLTFWFSNLILLRAIVSKGVENKDLGDDQCLNCEQETFLVALEKVEAWTFSRIIESVWWQTLTPYMQSAAAKSSSSRKTYSKRYTIGDQDQGNFSIDLWKRAFKDACERLCPLRAGGLECGCLHVISRTVMEQLVNRLDVAMFNAILRESADEMPTDPISDPISDSKVLPIASGKSGFGAGAQLKNAVGDWSRWLSDLFGIDDCDSHEDNNENGDIKYESSFKPFPLLNTLSDLMMLPFEMLADSSMRKEVCPRLGISLIKQVVNNFVPDEFTPGPVPDAVLEALNNEDIVDDEGSISSFPCAAASTFYAPPPASSVVSMLKEVGTPSLRSGSFVLKKLYTSDDELDELDSPLSALGMDDPKKMFAVVKEGRKVVRYELLKEVWKTSE